MKCPQHNCLTSLLTLNYPGASLVAEGRPHARKREELRRDLIRRALRLFKSMIAAATVGAVLFVYPAVAAVKIVVMGHRVHQDTATTGSGGDVTTDWRKANDADVEWITLGNDPLRERLFREVSLGETAVNVGFVLNAWATPKIAKLFTPLNDYLAKAPIADFADISPSMLKAMTFEGKIYAVPYRHATQGLHYNESFLKERGIDHPPRTVEELINDAKRLTYVRPDRTNLSGLVLGAYTHQIALLRAMGGAFITPELKFGGPDKAIAAYYQTIRDLFTAGVLPKAMPTFDQNSPLEWMSQGRTAMVIYPMARNAQMNDPKLSKHAGQVKVTVVPAAAGSGLAVAPAIFEFWAAAIPANAKNKDLAWSFIRHLSAPDSTVREALNGNGPVRASAYKDPRLRQKLTYAEEEQKAFFNGEAAIPAFDNTAKAAEIWKENFEAAMLGFMSPSDAAADLRRRVSALLP